MEKCLKVRLFIVYGIYAYECVCIFPSWVEFQSVRALNPILGNQQTIYAGSCMYNIILVMGKNTMQGMH